jgi:hypothetical protein
MTSSQQKFGSLNFMAIREYVSSDGLAWNVAHLRSLEEETSAYQSAQLPKGLLESTALEEALPSRSETGGENNLCLISRANHYRIEWARWGDGKRSLGRSSIVSHWSIEGGGMQGWEGGTGVHNLGSKGPKGSGHSPVWRKS